jgi:hypothetical protein
MLVSGVAMISLFSPPPLFRVEVCGTIGKVPYIENKKTITKPSTQI